jgi:predicted enzyme related to lactoylglutathione lyase
MPTIEYFQIPADDINRAQEFYKKVFGWEMQKWNNPEKPEQEYWMFQTQDEKGNRGLGGRLNETPKFTTYSYKVHYHFIYRRIFLKDGAIRG